MHQVEQGLRHEQVPGPLALLAGDETHQVDGLRFHSDVLTRPLQDPVAPQGFLILSQTAGLEEMQLRAFGLPVSKPTARATMMPSPVSIKAATSSGTGSAATSTRS